MDDRLVDLALVVFEEEELLTAFVLLLADEDLVEVIFCERLELPDLTPVDLPELLLEGLLTVVLLLGRDCVLLTAGEVRGVVLVDF